MQREIEAKFLNIDHSQLRTKLQKLGAKCEHPMRLMRRVMFDYPDHRFQKNNQQQRLRVRDEGDKVTITYKAKNKTDYSHEIETTVGSYNDMVNILEAIGLTTYSFQESKRETWQYKDVEVVLDEWPWLDTYIEIEGPSEEAIKSVAIDLGYNWNDAKFGSVDTAYYAQYPGMKNTESIGDLPEVKFNLPVPEYLKKRLTK